MRKPIDRPSTAPSRMRAWMSRAGSTAKVKLAAHAQSAPVLRDGEPAATRSAGSCCQSRRMRPTLRVARQSRNTPGTATSLPRSAMLNRLAVALETPSAAMVSGRLAQELDLARDREPGRHPRPPSRAVAPVARRVSRTTGAKSRKCASRAPARSAPAEDLRTGFGLRAAPSLRTPASARIPL